MPSGRTHDRITFLSLPLIMGLGFLSTRRGELTAIISGAYLFSGLMFGPDLDIYSIQYKRWGILRWIWLPYQSRLKHRSFLSHGFLIGTILRLFYLSILVTLIAMVGMAIAQLIGGFQWNWQHFAYLALNFVIDQYPYEAMSLFIGLELGAMSHSISDRLGTAFKRSQNPPKKRRTQSATKRKNTRRSH